MAKSEAEAPETEIEDADCIEYVNEAIGVVSPGVKLEQRDFDLARRHMDEPSPEAIAIATEIAAEITPVAISKGDEPILDVQVLGPDGPLDLTTPAVAPEPKGDPFPDEEWEPRKSAHVSPVGNRHGGYLRHNADGSWSFKPVSYLGPVVTADTYEELCQKLP